MEKFKLQCLVKNLPVDWTGYQYIFVNKEGRVGLFDTNNFTIYFFNKENDVWNEYELPKGDLKPKRTDPDYHFWRSLAGLYDGKFKVVIKTSPKDERRQDYFLDEVWLFDIDNIKWKNIQTESKFKPDLYNPQFISEGFSGIYLFANSYSHRERKRVSWILNLEEWVHTGKAYWNKVHFNDNNICLMDYRLFSTDDGLLWQRIRNDSVTKVDLNDKTIQEVQVNHLQWPVAEGAYLGSVDICAMKHKLVWLVQDKNGERHVLSIDTRGHQGQQPLTSNLLVPCDQASRMVLCQKFSHMEFQHVTQTGEIIFTTKKGRYFEVYSLKIMDPTEEVDYPSRLVDHMKKLLLSTENADLILIVGPRKTKIPSHEIIVNQSPWIARCLTNAALSSDGKIELEIPECKEKEVSLILELLYTGNFKRPDPLDLKAWKRLWKASNKFELKDLAEECYKRIPDDPPGATATDIEVLLKKKQCNVCFMGLAAPLCCLIPCGHTGTCKNCVEKIRSGNDSPQCPICRTAIGNVQDAFIRV